MGTINREWHLANRMPTNPSQDQRAKWHFEHAQACGCRAPSPAEAELIAEYGARVGAQQVGDTGPDGVQ